MISERYSAQVRLLLELLPIVAKEECFALKGGTAINMFCSNLPRLSVDIDLVYLPVENRENSYAHINSSLDRIKGNIERTGKKASVLGLKGEKKIIVSSGIATVKIEPNYTFRGSVLPPATRDVCKEVEDKYSFASIKLLAEDELYAGKICAALDRQHPRDLFDIRGLLSRTGITDRLFDVFTIYLIAHNRPMHELLDCNIQNRESAFADEFSGMTGEPFTYEKHLETLKALKAEILKRAREHSKFLLYFTSLEADFSQTAYPSAKDLPAVKWKIENLKRLQKENPTKFKKQINLLEKLLT